MNKKHYNEPTLQELQFSFESDVILTSFGEDNDTLINAGDVFGKSE